MRTPILPSAVFLFSVAVSIFINPIAAYAATGEALPAVTSAGVSLAARWGRGTISKVAFGPDGSFFVVGSPYGIAVYSMRDLAAEPRWIPLPEPVYYEQLLVSADGMFLRLEPAGESVFLSLETGQIVSPPAGGEWAASQFRADIQTGLSMVSPDGKISYTGDAEYVIQENDWGGSYMPVTYQKLISLDTGEAYYEEYDPVRPVQFHDYHEAEGCDLYTFSMCGNAFEPIPNEPFLGAFSPDGATFAILYRPLGLWRSSQFSVLRIFRTRDGAMIRAAGSYTHPVEDFAYSPDGSRILAGFVDGTVQLIDIASGEIEHSSRHFGSPIRYMEYTGDGRFLLIQRANELEIRRTVDGALRARFDAVSFAQSAEGSRLAIASPENEIRVIDLATWEDVHRFQAHDDVIFALAFSPDGGLLASSGQDCRIKVWDMQTGEYLHDYEQIAVDAYGEGFTFSRIFVKQLQFIPGTDQLIGFGSWGTAVSWHVESGAARYLVESAPLEYWNGMITLNPHFPEFFGSDAETGRFYINELAYSLDDGSVLGPYVRPDGLPDGCFASGPVTPDGRLRFTRGYDHREGSICVLDNVSLALLEEIEVALVPPGGRYSDLGWLYLSPDGSQLAAYTYSGAVYLYAVAPEGEATGSAVRVHLR